MSGTRAQDDFAYALCDGTPFGETGTAGVGVVLRNGLHQRIMRSSTQVREGSAARARLAAIAEALRICRERGIRRVTVYCHDPSVVEKITHREHRDPGTLSGCLEVRALMNTFKMAEVRSLPWLANLEAAWLAKDAARQPSAEATRHLQPTLPLDAA